MSHAYLSAPCPMGREYSARLRNVWCWQGPTETALYVYGLPQPRCAPLLDSYPLCERARIVQVAPASDSQGDLS
jgi:hypothetical protein